MINKNLFEQEFYSILAINTLNLVSDLIEYYI